MKDFVRLGDHTLKIGSGQTPRGGESSYLETGIPLIRSQNVLMGSFSREGLAHISLETDESMSGSRVARGDVLLNITGASIGRVCVVPDEICPANVNQHVCIIRCAESLCPEYVAAFIASPKFQRFILESQAGGTRQALTKQMIEEFQIPWRPRTLQCRLAKNLKTQLAELEAAHQAAKLQSRDIALLRNTCLAEIIDGIDAPHKVLGEFAETTSGSTPSRDNQRYWNPAEIPWIKTAEVAFAPIFNAEEAVSKVALAECSLSLLPKKTVLVAMYGQGKTRGQSAVLEIQATTNQACFAILPNETWEPEFLQLWLMASYHKLRNLSADRGGNQANLNGQLLNALEIPAPNSCEQLRIVCRSKAILDEIDTLASQSRLVRDNLAQMSTKLLAQAFEN